MTITTSALESIVPSPVDPATGRAPGLVSWYAESFSDSLGDRLLLFDNRGPGLELLRFHHQLGSDPAFESALRARVEALSGFVHPAFVRPRTVTWLDDPHPRLALVSEVGEGERLSAILAAARHADARLDDGAALWLLRQLLEALGALHQAGPGVRHGLLTPERVVLAPGGRLSVTEYVLGGAMSRLGGANRPAVLDDIAQAARLGASVLLGRPVGVEAAESVLRALDQRGTPDRRAAALRRWLERALGSDAGFASATEARAALDDALPDARVSWTRPLLATEQPPEPLVASPLPTKNDTRPTTPAYDPDATIEYRLPDLPLMADAEVPVALPTARRPTVTLRDLAHWGAVAARWGAVAAWWGAVAVRWGARVSLRTAAALGSALVHAGSWRSSNATVRRLWLACSVLAVLAVIEAVGLAVLAPGRLVRQVGVVTTVPDTTSPAVAPAPRPTSRTAGTDRADSSGSGSTQRARSPAAVAGPAPTRSAAQPPRAAAGTRPSASAGTTDADSVIGWISIQTPFEVRVYANGRLLGSGFSQRYRLPEGRHIITVASDAHGVRSTQAIDVEPGRTVAVAVDTPSN